MRADGVVNGEDGQAAANADEDEDEDDSVGELSSMGSIGASPGMFGAESDDWVDEECEHSC